MVQGLSQKASRNRRITSEAVTAASACVQEADIRKWFSQITEALIKEGVDLEILKDPSRI